MLFAVMEINGSSGDCFDIYQGTGTHDSQAKCGSFEDGIWLA